MLGTVFLTERERTTVGLPVGVAVKAPTLRHHYWVSCLRGKHGGGLPTRRQLVNTSGSLWERATSQRERGTFSC